MREITLTFYGVLAEIAGTHQTTVSHIETIDELKTHMGAAYPGINKHNYIIAVNNKIAGNNQSIHHGSSIAIMPPFSGG